MQGNFISRGFVIEFCKDSFDYFCERALETEKILERNEKGFIFQNHDVQAFVLERNTEKLYVERVHCASNK